MSKKGKWKDRIGWKRGKVKIWQEFEEEKQENEIWEERKDGEKHDNGGKEKEGERKVKETGREKTWREKAGKKIEREGVRKWESWQMSFLCNDSNLAGYHMTKGSLIEMEERKEEKD